MNYFTKAFYKNTILIFFHLFIIIFIITIIYFKEIERIKKLIKLFNSPINKIIFNYKTYIKNKKELYIIPFSNDNIIIHEIAHSLTEDIGHTERFYKKLFELNKKYNLCQ